MNRLQVSKLRQTARQLKRSIGITHYEALDRIAHDNGFSSWSDLQSSVAAESSLPAGTQPVTASTPARDPDVQPVCVTNDNGEHDRDLAHGVQTASEPALAHLWGNDADTAYDHL